MLVDYIETVFTHATPCLPRAFARWHNYNNIQYRVDRAYIDSLFSEISLTPHIYSIPIE